MIRGVSFLFSFFERYYRSTPDGLGAFCIPMRGGCYSYISSFLPLTVRRTGLPLPL